MHRSLEPEILDSLPPDHPDALRNRRDLALTNKILGTHAWLEATLPSLVKPNERILELGAGTGELGARLNRAGLLVDGMDLWPRPAIWPAGSAWHQADLLEFERFDAYPAVVGNLILHQFGEEDLASLGAKLRRHCRLIVACEPARWRRSQWLFKGIAPLLGANHVTMHDAIVSIAAGFRDNELADRLGLDEAWSISVATTFFGVYRMVAVRRE